MKLFVCNITELISRQEDSEMWQQALSNLPAQRMEKVRRYKYHEDKARSIAAGFLLGYTLKKECGLTSWELAYGEQGKPYFKDVEGFHFNLSHSENYVLLGIDDNPCGVDIQKKKVLRSGFAKRFFHPRELEYGIQKSSIARTNKNNEIVQTNDATDDISADGISPDDVSVDIQMEIWSMKEAFMKYSGKGMSRNLLSFSVVPLLAGEIMEEEGRNVVGASFSLLPEYSICAVWEGTHACNPEIKIISWNELFEEA